MADPQTVNVALFVPNTGADVDTWGSAALNPDFVALDGLIAGVQTIGATNIPITLTSPAGFVATPSPGPTQAQNRVLRFTGVLTGNVRVTLPLPGVYLIDNRTTGNFVLSFQGVTATEVVGIEQGVIVEIYNDGANVRFVNLGNVGEMKHWAGIIAMPAWVAACTVKPYLLADNTISNIVDFPYLGAKFGATFGGNGATTFGVPDMAGRVPLAYDRTGTRITTVGCGLNGQTLGASIDTQSVTLAAAQIPAITSNGSMTGTCVATGSTSGVYVAGTGSGVGGGGAFGIIANASVSVSGSASVSGSVTSNNTGGQAHSNVQPSIVTGIWVVKT